MPTQDWLKSAFCAGYSSGDLTLIEPDQTTRHEEGKIGGSYRRVLEMAVAPFLTPNSRVLEIGPGAGSWTRAMLSYVPEGEVHTLDFIDLTELLKPNEFRNRLFCHTITETDYDFLPNDFFDFFFSFGVMCHTMPADRHNILRRVLPKMRARAYSVHQYADWRKLDKYGWERGGVPSEFKHMPDEEIWWPRNDSSAMAATARSAGWRLVTADMDLFERDGMVLLSRPE